MSRESDNNQRGKHSSGSQGGGSRGGSHSSGSNDGDMTVREAGQKGGQRVRELVEEGKESEHGSGSRGR